MTVLRRIRLAALLVLLLLGLPGYILAGRSYSSDHAFTVENGQTIKASPTEGDRISMSVTMHHSINGLWAAPSGIYLSLTGQPPITLVGARYGDWGRSISSTNAIGAASPCRKPNFRMRR